MQVSILMVRALAAVIERRGASREQFLQQAGIEPRWIEEGALRISTGAYVRAIEAALEVSGDPAFGLHMGELVRSSMFDVIGPLTEHAATLRQSVEAMTRYARLMAESPVPELHEDGEVASVRIDALRGDWPSVRMTAELALTALAMWLDFIVGNEERPLAVCFAYRAPPYVAEYRRIFGELAQFEREHTELVFPRAWLDRPLPYRSPEIYAVLKEQAERSLGRLERDASLRARIERILAQHGAQPATMDDVARELGISARSLRRKMTSEGIRYSELMERNRMHTAMRLLEQPGASIQETAYAMGFASPAAFHRAFKRWTGMTPKQYQDSF